MNSVLKLGGDSGDPLGSISYQNCSHHVGYFDMKLGGGHRRYQSPSWFVVWRRVFYIVA